MTHRVIAPYVVVKVHDEGGTAVRGYHKGAVLPEGADADHVAHLVEFDMVEKLDEPEPEAAPVAHGAPAELKRPASNASKDAWVDYAVARRPEGMSEEDARTAAEAKTKADLVAEYGS